MLLDRVFYYVFAATFRTEREILIESVVPVFDLSSESARITYDF